MSIDKNRKKISYFIDTENGIQEINHLNKKPFDNSWCLMIASTDKGALPATTSRATKMRYIVLCSCGYECDTIHDFGVDVRPRCEKCFNEKYNICLFDKDDSMTRLYDENDFYSYKIVPIDDGYKLICSFQEPYFEKSDYYLKNTTIASLELKKDVISYKSYLDTGHTLSSLHIQIKLEKVMIFYLLQKYSRYQKVWDTLPTKIQTLSKFITMTKHQLKSADALFFDMTNNYYDNFLVTKSVKEILLKIVINNHPSKSIKRAIFKIFSKHKELRVSYNPIFDYAFSRTIKNNDLLLQLILQYKADKFSDFTFENPNVIIWLINFLKNYYTEKQIVKLFNSCSINYDCRDSKANLIDIYFSHTLSMIENDSAQEMLKENFNKVQLNWRRLHDEFSACIRERITIKDNRMFSYQDSILLTQGTHRNLQFYLPMDDVELLEMSRKLNNCLFSYSDILHNTSTLIYGVKKDSVLTYAVEIYENKINQAYAKENSTIAEDDMAIIESWYNKHKIQDNFLQMETICHLMPVL